MDEIMETLKDIAEKEEYIIDCENEYDVARAELEVLQERLQKLQENKTEVAE